MCLGAQIIGPWLAKDLITAFITARFSTDEDCRRRVRKLHELELEAARELKDQV
jgi:ribose 5-phosphate isomerase B